MEESLPPARSGESSLPELAESIAEARSQTREMMAAQRARLEEMEAVLAQHVQAIADELATDRQATDSERDELERQAAELTQEKEHLLAEHRAWQQIQDEAEEAQRSLAGGLERQQAETEARQKELEDRESQVRAAQRAVAATQEEVDEAKADLQRARLRLEEKQHAHGVELKQFAHQRDETKSQRRRAGRLLKEQRTKHQNELQEGRAELERLAQRDREQQAEQCREIEASREQLEQARVEVEQSRAELEQSRPEVDNSRAEVERLRADVEQSRAEVEQSRAEVEQSRVEVEQARAESDQSRADVEWLRGELEADQKRLAEETAKLQTRLDEAASRGDDQAAARGEDEARLDQLEKELAAAHQQLAENNQCRVELERELAGYRDSSGEQSGELVEKLRADREALLERLATAESEVHESKARQGEAQQHEQKLEELQRRFEMAVEDVREYKTRCAELEEELRTAQSSGGDLSATADGDRLDWEAQKQQLLASLESDYDDDDEEESQQRMTIEGTIHITDEVVAEKDQEISELKRLLDEQSTNLEGVAVGAAAIAEALDQDELIREERQRLQRVKEEWQEKLRQAEIDISLERAKIARERVDIEEKARTFESRLAELKTQSSEDDDTAEAEPGERRRSRWLSRLGLKDEGEEG